jgi:hypothetical protein
MGKGQVSGHVLDENLPTESLLYSLDPRRNVHKRFFRVRQRQQIMGIVTTAAAPTQMIRYPGWLEAMDEKSQLVEIFFIQWIGRAQRTRHAMEHEGRYGSRLLQDCQRASATDHEIFRDRLEPIDPRRAFPDTRVVLRAQADPMTKRGH